MRSTRSGGWVAGTVVLVVAIFAATWFFVAAPRFEAAAQTLSEAESSRVENDLMRSQLAKLREDFSKLDDYKLELAGLQTQMPQAAELTAYTRTLDALAAANGVTILDLSPGAAQTVVPVSPVVAQPVEPVDDLVVEEPDAGADPVGKPVAPAPTGPEPIDGFVAVPMTLRVSGTYANVTAFLEALQTGTERLFLITQLDGTSLEAAEASGGRPAIADGDLELTVNGFTYVLVNPEAVVAELLEGEEAPAPLPSTDRNPFAPLPGTETSSD